MAKSIRRRATEKRAVFLLVATVIAEFLLVVEISIVAGVAANIVSALATHQPLRDLWCWFAGAVALVLVLAVLRWFVGWHRDRRGTLHYWRILDASMRGRHEEDLDAHVPGYRDIRAVTRWCPTAGASKDGEIRGVDVVDVVSSFVVSAEQQMSTDDIRTSYEIAPDMLWPQAMSVGSQSFWFERTKLRELDRDGPAWTPTHQPWDELRKHPDAQSVRQPARTPIGTTAPIPLLLEIVGGRIEPEGLDREECLVLGLRDRDGRVAQLQLNPRASVPQLLPSSDDGTPPPPPVVADPNVVISACADSIRRLLQDNPQAHVVLMCRLPKTVSLALGWRLGHKFDFDPHGLFDPWERLITVQLTQDQTRGGAWFPLVTRVNPAQPPLEEMLEITRQTFAGDHALAISKNTPS